MAAAADVPYTDTVTENCVFLAETKAERLACIGASAHACVQAASDGRTQAGMSRCLSRELRYWDKALNRTYQSLKYKAKRVDAAEQTAGAREMERHLRQMQLNWIAFRDATCAFEQMRWEAEDGPVTQNCLMRVTAQQALYLQGLWIGQ